MFLFFLVPGPQTNVRECSDFLFTCLIIGAIALLYAFRPRSLRYSTRNVINKSSNEPVSVRRLCIIDGNLKTYFEHTLFAGFTWGRSAFADDELNSVVQHCEGSCYSRFYISGSVLNL